VVGDLRVTTASARQVMALPMFPELQRGQMEYVARSLAGVR